MASQHETEKAYYRVMMDLQSYFLAKSIGDASNVKMMEHNLRQHVLYYRDHLMEHMVAPEWTDDNKDVPNG